MFNQDTWMSSRLGKFTASEIGNLLTESKKKMRYLVQLLKPIFIKRYMRY